MQKLSCALFLALFAFAPLAAAELRTVSVDGNGELEVEPDRATLSAGVFFFDADLVKAKQKADATMAALLKNLKKLKIKSEDIQTTQLYVNPKYGDREGQWEFIGYEVTQSLTVTLHKLEDLNDVIDRSIEAGANRIENIELF